MSDNISKLIAVNKQIDEYAKQGLSFSEAMERIERGEHANIRV